MGETRAALERSSPAAAVGPDASGIDDDLESALLAGLANLPEAPDEEPAAGAKSDSGGPPGGTVGVRTPALDAGASGAAAAPPADRPDPDGEKEPRVGLPGAEPPDAAPEPAPVPRLDLEEASDGAPPPPPPWLPEDRNPTAEPAAFGADADRLAEAAEASPDGAEPSAGLYPRAEPEARFEDRHWAGAGENGTGSTGDPDAGPGADAPDFDALLQGLSDAPSFRASDAPSFRDGDPGTPSASSPEPEVGSEPTPRTGNGADAEPVHYHSAIAEWSSPAFSPDPALEQALREGLSASLPSTASHDDPDAREPEIGSPPGAAPEPAPDPEARAAPPSLSFDPGLDSSSLSEDGAPSATGGEPTVLAFATDPESESALREGLSEHPNPQVWPGGLRSAIATLGAGQSSPVLFVDLDETTYPAGAIHELAAVCEVGTVVIAFGSDGTARFSREVLLAGVSDYLVKPIDAAAVREAAARAAASARADAAQDRAGGWSVGFAGTGGSGATTLAAAAALLAAERGRYVSVLDLNRAFPTLSFLLDVEPAPGLVELLSTVARASLHPEVVDGMRAERSDRVAVYGYPWSATPPPCPPVWAICELLVELQRRSHLVIVDGLDDPATRISLLATVDARVVVVEPTVTGAAGAAGMLTRFGPMFDPDWPLLLVQNHTRPLKPRAGARILRDAGVEATPDVVVPFEPALPAHADRGWPEGRLPRSLRKSFTTLADRILAAPAAVPVLA